MIKILAATALALGLVISTPSADAGNRGYYGHKGHGYHHNYRRGYGYRRGGDGAAFAFGMMGTMLGAAIASQAYRPAYRYEYEPEPYYYAPRVRCRMVIFDYVRDPYQNIQYPIYRQICN